MSPTVICYIYKGNYLIFPSTGNSAGLFRAGESVWSIGRQPRGACRGWLPGAAVVCVRVGWRHRAEERAQSRAVLSEHEVTDLQWAWMG